MAFGFGVTALLAQRHCGLTMRGREGVAVGRCRTLKFLEVGAVVLLYVAKRTTWSGRAELHGQTHSERCEFQTHFDRPPVGGETTLMLSRATATSACLDGTRARVLADYKKTLLARNC